jgi:putative Holliday junction resolvase
MRVLALDHGSARCGCAISDPTGTIVRPLPAIARPEAEAGRAAIAGLVEAEGVELVVVGLPRLQSGAEGSQASAARAFAGRLAADIQVPVRMHDERFTTRMAQASIAQGAVSEEDSLAAAHLLEEFLDLNRPTEPTS